MTKAARPRTRPGRPSTPLITRAVAVDAAIALIDRDGLGALSLQAVARALSVTAPSLYHHFRDKDELLQLVARALLVEVGAGHRADAGWEERAIELAVATRRVILRHANAAPLLLRFFPRSLMLSAYETMLAGCPYPHEHQAVILEALEKLTYGVALFAAAARVHPGPAMPVFEADRHPFLSRALAAAPRDEETLFVEAIRALFDGFRTRYGGAA